VLYDNKKFGAGTGKIVLDGFTCDNNETSLTECSHGKWGQYKCKEDEYLCIACADYPTAGK